MGEIAEMMLDGTLCECCGEYIGSDAGYPQYCSEGCAADRGLEFDNSQLTEADAKVRAQKINCPKCGKLVKRTGLAEHQRVKHSPIIHKRK